MPEEAMRGRSRLDPRTPLVVDTRALGRRPGSLRRLTRTVPAPAMLGIDVVGVPEGADLELDIRLEAVMEGVLVTGSARAPVHGECGRCLDPVVSVAEISFQELYVYPGHGDEEEELRLEGDLLDLEPMVRDAVVLALPLQPLCREDCPGLCPSCGQPLAEDPTHRHEQIDPRWVALRGLVDANPTHDEPKIDEREN